MLIRGVAYYRGRLKEGLPYIYIRFFYKKHLYEKQQEAEITDPVDC